MSPYHEAGTQFRDSTARLPHALMYVMLRTPLRCPFNVYLRIAAYQRHLILLKRRAAISQNLTSDSTSEVAIYYVLSCEDQSRRYQ